MNADQRGSVALMVALLLPLLLTTASGVLQLGALRVIAARAASAADLATLAATDDQDEAELVRAGTLRLAVDAESVARSYFALNLEPIAALLGVTPAEAAARADIAVFRAAPVTDPVTGWRYERPTVRIAASLPVRTVGFGVLLPAITTITVRAASAPR